MSLLLLTFDLLNLEELRLADLLLLQDFTEKFSKFPLSKKAFAS